MTEKKPWEKSCGECESMSSDYPCPITNCSKHKNDEDIHWVHKGCGGGFRLYENGKEKCQKCGIEDYFCKWTYSCSYDAKNQHFNYTKIRNILQKIIGMDSSKISACGLFNILTSIKHQTEKFPECFD